MVSERGRRVRSALWVLAVLASLVVVCLLFRQPLLVWVGDRLVRADPLAQADAIVVLAGGTPQRELEGADLYIKGYAPLVVLTVEPDSGAAQILRSRGIPYETQIELKQRILRSLGVPGSAIALLQETRATSTRMETDVVRRWTADHHARRIIVVTSPYHTARASLVFRRALADDQVEVLVRPASHEPFDPERWWTDRIQLRNGVFELQKLLLYYVAYW
jgi:uncharacterized SAM-binding protein YcdF (DUF218 family)